MDTIYSLCSYASLSLPFWLSFKAAAADSSVLLTKKHVHVYYDVDFSYAPEYQGKTLVVAYCNKVSLPRTES